MRRGWTGRRGQEVPVGRNGHPFQTPIHTNLHPRFDRRDARSEELWDMGHGSDEATGVVPETEGHA